MAASLGARLLGCGLGAACFAHTSCAGLWDGGRGRPRLWGAGTPSPGLPGGLFGIPPAGSDGRSQTRAACTGFPFTGAVWAPFHLLGKQREVRSEIVQLPRPTGGETEVQNAEQNAGLPILPKIPQKSPGPGPNESRGKS